MQVRCPHCHNPIEIVDGDDSLKEVDCPSCGSSFNLLGDDTRTALAEDHPSIGHFEMIHEVGKGSFGSVWMARDTKLDRTVAVKLPRKGQLGPKETEQFLREARAAAQLKHPNIVPVHEVGRHDETIYIVSDFIRGISLADWLTGDKPSIAESVELCRKTAESLHHAHEAGVIHRDLKPSNVLLDQSRRSGSA